MRHTLERRGISVWLQIKTQTTFLRSHDLDLGRERSNHHGRRADYITYGLIRKARRSVVVGGF